MIADGEFVLSDLGYDTGMCICRLSQAHAWNDSIYIKYKNEARVFFDIHLGDDTPTTAPILFIRYFNRAEGRGYDGFIEPHLIGLVPEPLGQRTFKRIGRFTIRGAQVPQILTYLDYRANMIVLV
jgi:hypothetical protein